MGARLSDCLELTYCILYVCLRQGSREERKKKRGSVTPFHVTVTAQDTEGSKINLADAPKIEPKPPLEQDAGYVRTSWGHCGQLSYFWCVTRPGGAETQEPASRLAHTKESASSSTRFIKINLQSPAKVFTLLELFDTLSNLVNSFLCILILILFEKINIPRQSIITYCMWLIEKQNALGLNWYF